MNLGKETSESLGISYSLLEKLALFLVALTTSVTMITVGGLPFLGVIVPNLVRKRYGDNLSQTKLMVALVGANLVLACDILSRVLIRPYELSVSLLLGIIGSLVFILLLWRGTKRCSLKANIPSSSGFLLFLPSELVFSTFGPSLTCQPLLGSYVPKRSSFISW